MNVIFFQRYDEMKSKPPPPAEDMDVMKANHKRIFPSEVMIPLFFFVFPSLLTCFCSVLFFNGQNNFLLHEWIVANCLQVAVWIFMNIYCLFRILKPMTWVLTHLKILREVGQRFVRYNEEGSKQFYMLFSYNMDFSWQKLKKTSEDEKKRAKNRKRYNR